MNARTLAALEANVEAAETSARRELGYAVDSKTSTVFARRELGYDQESAVETARRRELGYAV
jgi:hypothetical protein